MRFKLNILIVPLDVYDQMEMDDDDEQNTIHIDLNDGRLVLDIPKRSPFDDVSISN